jgi:hypothetical protein
MYLPNPFCFLVVFQVGTPVFAGGQPQTMDLLLQQESTGVNHHTWLIDLVGGLDNFLCRSWPQIVIRISGSQVAGITE